MRNLNMETSTHSQGYQSEAKVQPEYDAKWVYRVGHISADGDEGDGDEEEEWDSPQVESAKKEERGSSEQQDKKEEEGDSETGEDQARGAGEQQDKKEEVGDSETEEDHHQLTAHNCLQAFKDMQDGKGFDCSGDGKKNLPPKWPARKSLQKRSGEKHKRAQRRSSIKHCLNNLDL